MGYADYLRAIRKYWWMVVVSILVCGTVGIYITTTTPKQYASSMTFFVQTPADQVSAAAQGDTFGQKRVNSYVQLAGTGRLLQPVISETGVNLTQSELAKEVTASGDVNTVLMTVTVTDPFPARSLLLAKAVSTQFVKLVASLESASAGGGSSARLELVSGPTLNVTPVEPRPRLYYSLAVLIGLLLGLAAAVLKDVLDTSVRTASVLERVTKSSVLGVIPFDDTAKASPLIVDTHAQSVRAEAFRQLRTNLDFVDVDNPARVVVVTSSVPNEGKSSTATNLAVIFAEAGKRVVLIEGDLRRPRVADYLGIEGTVGLTNVLAGQVDISEVLQPWGRGGLTILPSGSVPPNPSELLGSQTMSDLLSALSSQFDVVLIDSPPLLPVTDAAVLAAQSDGAVIIVRHGRTTRRQVGMAIDALKRVDARVLGSVLNMAPVRGADAYAYGYGYGYRGDYDSSDPMPLTSSASNAHPHGGYGDGQGGAEARSPSSDGRAAHLSTGRHANSAPMIEL